MPELPEVETALRGIRPHLQDQRITHVAVRETRLRQPIPPDFAAQVSGQKIGVLSRRAKYILIALERGCLLVHLGMTGSLRIANANTPPERHDHLDLTLHAGYLLRFHDPRRFGLFLWLEATPEVALTTHPLLKKLGPEPFDAAFSGEHLHALSQKRRVAVKAFIMDGSVVVGVGNIYANEALFIAGIHPAYPCNRITLAGYRLLARAIRNVLTAAIEQGGTTLRNFVREDGQPGYFTASLRIYGRTGEPCCNCGHPVQQMPIAQRMSFFCPQCQKVAS
ncbi:bifunctional DNA-formamidopyrimidine glycosylase/DNA-(apurinic or apyrimidinic site) lyase [Chromatium okenii]|uniref:Formamidopyrimidine-DNA glycosylase n=1 Tax=Chromatium okenii TaxID=61644 RepID=A0A2S7XQZ4_9GAMM|nr:bifunctional DNA-formamidopyrimidine glycosylase/DNA-(apurinic or apyrimidinic site) lyase [Chromatium okenii]MBV5309419.1 bifunctional DNA-formamidopyrimidine glycosylase/DNA-(apurinic or apyrimidinic site) lyase [Chromatium okenii]PQJ95821.1 DNA-formamidopyrimidine glycosylase [Chromatium okenii]